MKRIILLICLVLVLIACNKFTTLDRKIKTNNKSETSLNKEKSTISDVSVKTNATNETSLKKDKSTISNTPVTTSSVPAKTNAKNETFLEINTPPNVASKTANVSIDISCPSIAYLGKRVRIKIIVKNIGNKSLNSLIINGSFMLTGESLGSIGKIFSGEGNPYISSDFAIATWKIASLIPGQTKEYTATIMSRKCGKQCFQVTLNTSEGIRKKAECCTAWKCCGPSLLLECIDTVDPLIADEETTYIIEVTNQSTTAQQNIKIEAVFPAEISPISASGDTACTITGKHVTVASYPILLPKEKIRWEIQAKAIQPGDSRLKVYLSSELLKRPVTEEESTHVY